MNPLSPAAVTSPMLLLRIFFAALLGLAAIDVTAQTRIYVDPRGRDSWSGARPKASFGKADGPLGNVATALIQAREVRRLRPGEPVVIVLQPGRHELDAPLVFGPGDSGITPLGARGRRPPTLSGGTVITGWRRSTTNREIWEVTLPDVASGDWYFHQLFVRNQRVQRARTPNNGFFRAAGPLSKGTPTQLPFRPGDLRPAWADYPDARAVVLMKWTDLHLPIRMVDAEHGLATLAGGPRADWMDETGARYWVENVPDALDQRGEWYLDRRTGRLQYWAPGNFDPKSTEVIAPRLRELIQWRGEASGPRTVTRVTLRFLRFADCDYDMPAAGLVSPQAAVGVGGSLNARLATDCRIEDCRFENLGGYGLELGHGCQRWTVSGCQFQSLGGGGIRLGEPGDREGSGPGANHSHRVLDNRLFQLGRVFAPAVGVLIFHSSSNRIAHNHLRNLYYTGISVGWNWGYQATPCHDNEIDHNLVELIGQGQLSDLGGIYTLGPQPGTRIHHNIFRDIQSHDYGGWGLYTDEGSTGILLENNVVYHCKSAGFHQHYGRDNVIRNNLFAFNQEHQLMRSRSEDHRSFWFTNNVVIHDSGDLLGSNWEGSTNQFWLDRNVYWDTRLRADATSYRFGKDTREAWRRRGQDPHSIFADPLLVDPQRPELGLRPGSPAFALGFQQIDLHDVGPRPPGTRD